MTDPLNLDRYEVILLALYCLLVALFGLLGNSTVIYSSIRYNAIELDKVSLIFVRHLAVADILYTVCAIFPNTVTFLAGGWVLGDGWCFISAQLSFVPGLANIWLVVSITLYRLAIVLYPFTSVRCREARYLVLGIWTGAVILPLVVSTVYKASSSFNGDNGTCLSSVYTDPVAAVVVMVVSWLTIIIPIVILIAANITLCTIAVRLSRSSTMRRSNEIKNKRKGIILIMLISGLFILSWLPYLLEKTKTALKLEVSQALTVLAFHCIFLNSFGNPILYSLTPVQ